MVRGPSMAIVACFSMPKKYNEKTIIVFDTARSDISFD
jgi:hypothetical protein